jgi:hypothetical protein
MTNQAIRHFNRPWEYQPAHRRFDARETSRPDCVKCHADRGIWRARNNRNFYVCDYCLAGLLQSKSIINPRFEHQP